MGMYTFFWAKSTVLKRVLKLRKDEKALTKVYKVLRHLNFAVFIIVSYVMDYRIAANITNFGSVLYRYKIIYTNYEKVMW